MDPKEFQRYMISLIKKHDWLDCRKHLEALDNLFEECSDEEEMRMLIELIPHFTCTDENAFWAFYSNQAENIVNDGTITVANCIIVPTTEEDIPDSSQYVCYPFRSMVVGNLLPLQVWDEAYLTCPNTLTSVLPA